MTQYLPAAGCGVISALLFLMASAVGMGGVVLVYLMPLPIFAAGLGLGRIQAVAAAAVALAVMALAGTDPEVLAISAVTVFGPAAWVVRRAVLMRTGTDGAVEWYPTGPLLVSLLGLALAGFAAAAVMTAGEAGGLPGVLDGFIGEMFQHLEVPDGDQIRQWLAPMVPGMTGVSWILMMVVNGILAQGLVTATGFGLRPTPAFADLELPVWTAGLFAVGVALAMMPEPLGFVGINVALMCAAVAAFTGFAVIHAVVRAKLTNPAGARAFLVAVYTVVIVMSWPILLVIGLGVIEQTMGLRRRWIAGPHQGDK